MKQQQAGFTLMEFLIVIAILCILGIVVMPKMDLWQSAAREAKLEEVKQAMELTNNLVYAKACCKTSEDGSSVRIKGQDIFIDMESRYVRDAIEFAKLIDGVGLDGELNVHFWAEPMGVRYANTLALGSGSDCGVEYKLPDLNASPPETNPTYTLSVDGC